MKDNKTIWIVVLIIVLVLLLFPFGGMMGGFGGCGYGSMMYNYGFGGMLFGWLFMIAFLVALILFIVWLVQQIQKNERRKR